MILSRMTKHNDTGQNDTLLKDMQQNYTKQNDILLKDTQHK
jgi:hypothetical protein